MLDYAALLRYWGSLGTINLRC